MRSISRALLVILGLLLIAEPQLARAATATYLSTDTTTQGNWKGTYGSDGYGVVGDPSSNNPSDPGYDATAVNGAQTNVYSTSTTDPRALQAALPSSTKRVAAALSSTTTISLGFDVTDTLPHQLALYFLDWNNQGITETVVVRNGENGKALDTRDVSAFQNGLYLVWRVTGPIIVTITKSGTSPAACVSGWFFDYPGPILSSIRVTPSTASVAIGTTEQFTATANDQNGNRLATQPPITWSLAGAGGLSNSGLYEPGNVIGGSARIKATSGGITGMATAEVASTHTVTFGSPQTVNGIGVVDVDGDGYPDYITASSTGFSVFFGGPGNTYTQYTYPYTIPNLRGGPTVADLGNGRNDLVFVTSDSLAVVMNLGNRTFAAPVLYSGVQGENALTVGDFNEDGKNDVAVVGTGTGVGSTQSELGVLLNNGDGTFAPVKTYPIPGNYYGYAVGVVTLDLDGDGHLDIVCFEDDELATALASKFFGDGKGNFVQPSNWSITAGGESPGIADLNNDGIPDIFASDHWSNGPRWALSNGKGDFPVQATQRGLNYAHSISAADFDGDGFQDLAQTCDGTDNVALYVNNGDGTFALPVGYQFNLNAFMVGDFDHDGQPDLVTNLSPVTICYNTTNPAPTITNLVPDGAQVAGTQKLQVKGHGLLSRSVIRWNNSPLTTTFDYMTDTLSATLTPTQLALAGTAIVTVTTSAPGGGTSNPLPFYVGNVPTSIAISPNPVNVDAGASLQLSATVRDQYGQPMTTQPIVAWKTHGKANVVVNSGLYSAGNTAGPFSVTASYGGLTTTAPVNVMDFTISASPNTVNVAQGSSATSKIAVTPINGFSGFVRMTVSGLPTGVVATLNPGSVKSSTTLTFTASASAPLGHSTVTITGNVDGNPETTTIALAVTPPIPTDLTAVGGAGAVSLSWMASAGAASYNVYRGTASGGESGSPIATAITGTSYVDDAVFDGTTYYYTVAAVASADTSDPSNEASATPHLPSSHGQIVLQGPGEVDLWAVNGATVGTTLPASMNPPAGSKVEAYADFNGDGKPDLLLQDQTTGNLTVWYMNGASVTSTASFSQQPGSTWHVVGAGDFNNDGTTDLLFVDTARNLHLWYLNGITITGSVNLVDGIPAGWTAVGVGDFNGDGHVDILFENAHQLGIWYMNGPTRLASTLVSQEPPAGWSVGAVVNLTAQDEPNIVLQNGTGVVEWTLQGATRVSGATLSKPAPAGFDVVAPR